VAEYTYVERASAMAEFTDGRVKPVTVLKSTGANVVVFAFEPGTSLPGHEAQYPVIIEATVPHSVEAAERAKLQLTVLMIDSPGPSHIPLGGEG
jgi:hypothetical protein